MVRFLDVALLGALFLGAAHGASLATASSNEVKCTGEQRMESLECYLSVTDFMDKFAELKINETSTVKEVENSCVALLQKCVPSVTCDKHKKELIENLTAAIKKACDAIAFAHDISPCIAQLKKKKSTCFADWNPSIIEENIRKGGEVSEEEKKKACNNIFGKDDCIKTEMTETCGEQQWIGFREKFLDIHEFEKLCDINKESLEV